MTVSKLAAHSSRCSITIGSPVDAIVSKYVDHLRALRYADDTIQHYLASLRHFTHRLNKRLTLADIDNALVTEFVDLHLPHCRCPRPCMRHVNTVRAALRHLLAVLKQEGLCNVGRPQLHTPVDVELELFRHYLVDSCGYAQTTCRNRLWHIRNFLDSVVGQEPVTADRLTSTDIENFTARCFKGRCHATRRSYCVDLASYLRFRGLHGDDTRALLAAIPKMAPPIPARLPIAMTDRELDLFFAAFDLTKPIGMRDFAIARCLSDLALRRMEVARLQLGSFDWPNGTVTLTHNKGGRERKLPLPVQTAHALVRYLQHGRPDTSNRAVFVRQIAPYDKPISAVAINHLVRAAFVRAGLGERFRGVHVLRRTAATRLIRGGASLKEVADVLGHRHLNTTTIYTGVDLDRLRKVAQPWPERQS
ncbi:tyrosine-type recombinase/integrase [Paraburkholderia phymatum]|uniref:Integrase family protein n=1 Tax=Paraburkholderia phymatum (strain DSM 17167 / CIP 108236 / LMG 21445 / STM815) TaxID=391038 RepID=B2JSI2_PARP8|nr:tyrosine-type recombinase/integrase [Paraburkholderia phymatum]ACC74002.1 integrase family protein [Paraburkholderia phymatum STM815]